MAEKQQQAIRPFSGKQKYEAEKGVQQSKEKCSECGVQGRAVVLPCSPRCVYCPACVINCALTQASRSCQNVMSCKQCRKEWLPSVIKRYGGASWEEIDELNSLLTSNLSLQDGMVTCPMCGTSYRLLQPRHRNRMMRVKCENCVDRNGRRDCWFCWECRKPWVASKDANHCGNAGCLGSSSAKGLVVEGSLNRGAFGAVYNALKGDVMVVAKAVHSSLKFKEMENFKKEALLMKSLNHPNIVRCYGLEECNNELYLIMEKMDKGTLYDVVEKRLKEKWCASHRVGKQVILALEYLHGREPLIIHRDLSSGNILISSDNVVKVGDFGISRCMPSVKEYVLSHNQGTQCYMPPEVLGRDPKYTPKTDIFSLGVILLEIEILEHPIHDMIGIGHIPEVERRKEQLRKIDLRNPVRAIIVECLKNDLTERPCAAILKTMLEQIK